LTETLNATGATLPAWDIAVAADNSSWVAVVTDNRTAVYLSDDGGEEWAAINMPDDIEGLISDISFSPQYDNNYDIAIGTRNPNNVTDGDVWVTKLMPFISWNATGLNMDVSSVRFSPDYDALHNTILAIASNTTGTYLCTRHRIADKWEDIISPVEIKEAEDSPKENELIFSDLALPSASYAKKAGWIVYAAYYSNTSADDAYRVKHEAKREYAYVNRLKIKGGDKVSLASLVYGGGKLLAGEVLGKASSGTSLIHICTNAEKDVPKWKWVKPSEPPSGAAISGRANAQLAWIGGNIYCGTSTNYVENATAWANMTLPDGPWRGEKFDQSAFSVSKDGGDIWNQLSLIDTGISYLSDLALSSDAKTLYLASTSSTGFDSLWRSESEPLGETWQRVLCLPSKGDIILRATPEGSPEEAIFFAIVGNNEAGYSLDKGETWEEIWDCPDITDLAVVSNELFYILEDNLVNKYSWSKELDFWEWQRDRDTGLRKEGYCLATSGANFVFVGGSEEDEGKIAYSCDGGGNFTLTEAVPEPGLMRVIADEEFAANRFIYAASEAGKIYRWTVEGSTSWRELNPRYSKFGGLAQKGGALYGAYLGRKGVARTLVPRLATVTESDWDYPELGLPDAVRFKPGTLRATVSDEAVNLWAIDDHKYFNGDISQYEAPRYNTVGRLWIYSDTFALQTPWPTSPAMSEFLPCDICTCSAEEFCFHWRQLPLAKEYEIWIALDEEFTALINRTAHIIPTDLCSPAWCPPPDSPRFVCGETYYWKVRSSNSTEGEAIHSPWSPPMRFTVKTCSAISDMHITPILIAPQSGSMNIPRSPTFSWEGFAETTKYEFILTRNADLTVVIREELTDTAYQYQGELNWGETYIWQVKALEPAPSEPSAISTFTVMSQPQPAMPASQAIPVWIWLIIGILAVLDVIVIVLCIIRR
jgi:hypothetical protein